MEHRQLLAARAAHRPFSRSALLDRIGGQQAIAVLVDRLYDGIESDAELRPLFGPNLSREREAQKRFFGEWLGGPAAYTDHAQLPLKHRHDLLPITATLSTRWLAHFHRALEFAVTDADARTIISEQVSALTASLVNEAAGPPSALRARPHGVCLRYEPAIDSLAIVRRGDVSALRELLRRTPDVLASEVHAARLLQLAVLAGRLSAVEALLEHDVDVNKPSPIEPLILITPLCAARMTRRAPIEALLRSRGALEDAFSHAFLGELAPLRADLERTPGLAERCDPAVDALAITPIHHAVAGGHPEALQLLLSAIEPGQPLLGGERALRDAVMHLNVPQVRLLLERGVPAISLGAGRWVQHPELARWLSAAGAEVDRSGTWIGLSCTGNQGRKDDPEYVLALLRHGARVDDRRLVGQGSDGGRATALHYAAKAGFVNTIAVLLQHGADPLARDDHGLTPFDWLERAAKSVDRERVRSVLRASRAL